MAAVFVLIFVWMFIVISLKFIPSFFFVLIFISLIFIFIFVFVSVEISEMSSSRIAIVIVHDPISKSLRHGKGEIHLPHVGHHQNLIHGGIPRIDQQLEGIPFRRLDRTRFEGEFSSDIVLEVVQHHDIHVEIHFVQSPSPSSFVRILLLEQNQMQRPLQVHLPATATATASPGDEPPIIHRGTPRGPTLRRTRRRSDGPPTFPQLDPRLFPRHDFRRTIRTMPRVDGRAFVNRVGGRGSGRSGIAVRIVRHPIAGVVHPPGDVPRRTSRRVRSPRGRGGGRRADGVVAPSHESPSQGPVGSAGAEVVNGAEGGVRPGFASVDGREWVAWIGIVVVPGGDDVPGGIDDGRIERTGARSEIVASVVRRRFGRRAAGRVGRNGR
mmetsp:Transcript_27242/g.52366  ORF Transcript_27242/g.52366 Transcript_27242/m.52366 type:complete len:382 (-) Transcript_27242:482-1627(-)